MAHVMFSYQWDYQGLVLEVVRILKSQGVDVWVDVQGSTILGKMAGSTDEMMIKVCGSNTASCSAVGKCAQSLTTSVTSQAVNKSSHVVVFVSKKYLVSSNCNQEVLRVTCTYQLFSFLHLWRWVLISNYQQ